MQFTGDRLDQTHLNIGIVGLRREQARLRFDGALLRKARPGRRRQAISDARRLPRRFYAALGPSMHPPTRFVGRETTLPGIIAYWDRDLFCRFANHAYLGWSARDPPTLIGMTMPNSLGAALFNENRLCVVGVLRGERQSFVRSITKPDGPVAQTQATYVPDIDTSGAVVGSTSRCTMSEILNASRVSFAKGGCVVRDTFRKEQRRRAARDGRTGRARWSQAPRLPSPVLSWSGEIYRIHGMTPEIRAGSRDGACVLPSGDRARIQKGLERAASEGVP